MADDEFAGALRDAGHRVTPARRVVHGALVSAQGHVTVDELAATVADDVNLATVYRALSVLEEVGLARSVRLGTDGSASWEVAHPDTHVHLVCDACGAVDHHVGDAVERLRHHLLDDHGFAADDVELVVTGTCATCRGVAATVIPPSRPQSRPPSQPPSRPATAGHES